MRTDPLTGRFMAETRLTPQIVYTGRLEGLEGGRTYQIDLVDAFRDEVLASALVAPERKIAPSPNTHVLDGLFTVQVGEWAHIEPVWGRFTFLFADFDGECLHLINDWHVCRERINDWDCNKFLLTTWSESNDAEKFFWLIKVFPDGQVMVLLNEKPVEEFVEARYAHAFSPLIADTNHSIYELRIQVAKAHHKQGQLKPQKAWQWEMEWLDPIMPSLMPARAEMPFSVWPAVAQNGIFPVPELCEDAREKGGVMAKEPVRVRGALYPEGGLSLHTDWQPPQLPAARLAPEGPRPLADMRVTLQQDTAHITVQLSWDRGPLPLICRTKTLPALAPLLERAYQRQLQEAQERQKAEFQKKSPEPEKIPPYRSEGWGLNSAWRGPLREWGKDHFTPEWEDTPDEPSEENISLRKRRIGGDKNNPIRLG